MAIEKEAVRAIYEKLCAQYGRAGIDDITYPCWDETATETYKLWGGVEEVSYPYQDFLHNIKRFLSLLETTGTKMEPFVEAGGMAEWRVDLGEWAERPPKLGDILEEFVFDTLKDKPGPWRTYAHPQTDGVFVGQDRSLEPYPVSNDMTEWRLYPTIPKDAYYYYGQLPLEMAARLVERLNDNLEWILTEGERCPVCDKMGIYRKLGGDDDGDAVDR